MPNGLIEVIEIYFNENDDKFEVTEQYRDGHNVKKFASFGDTLKYCFIKQIENLDMKLIIRPDLTSLCVKPEHVRIW